MIRNNLENLDNKSIQREKRKNQFLRIIYCFIVFAALIIFGLFYIKESKSNIILLNNTNIEPSTKVKGDGLIGPYRITIDSCFITKNSTLDRDIIVINYTFTNNSKEQVIVNQAVIDQAYQNNLKLEHCFFFEEDEEQKKKQLDYVNTGESIQVSTAYYLTSASIPVEVKIQGNTAYTNSIVARTFNLK